MQVGPEGATPPESDGGLVHFQVGAFHRLANRFYRVLMTEYTFIATALRPTSVTIHDNGDMFRQDAGLMSGLPHRHKGNLIRFPLVPFLLQ